MSVIEGGWSLGMSVRDCLELLVEGPAYCGWDHFLGKGL